MCSTSAALNFTCRRARRPPAMARFPRRVLLSCATGTSPVSSAASSPVMVPIPGTERRIPAVSDKRSSAAMAQSIRSSSSLTKVSIRCFKSVSTSSNIAAVPSFQCARTWASTRLRVSTSSARFDVKDLRMRSFLRRLRPASGRNARIGR